MRQKSKVQVKAVEEDVDAFLKAPASKPATAAPAAPVAQLGERTQKRVR